MAAGVLLGPVVAGWLVESFGWETMAWVMGAFSLSGAVPAVS
jgi:MFS family permease